MNVSQNAPFCNMNGERRLSKHGLKRPFFNFELCPTAYYCAACQVNTAYVHVAQKEPFDLPFLFHSSMRKNLWYKKDQKPCFLNHYLQHDILLLKREKKKMEVKQIHCPTTFPFMLSFLLLWQWDSQNSFSGNGESCCGPSQTIPPPLPLPSLCKQTFLPPPL